VGDPVLPLSTRLAGNYPNPFNPTTRIQWDLAQAGPVKLRVYNMLGQQVATLVTPTLPAGSHSVDWNAGTCPAACTCWNWWQAVSPTGTN
jgi:hypothetical protein